MPNIKLGVGDMNLSVFPAEWLYFLDAFQLDNAKNVKFAKGICVESCPPDASLCSSAELPCKNNSQYTCDSCLRATHFVPHPPPPNTPGLAPTPYPHTAANPLLLPSEPPTPS
jgi:hypothetical protein